MNFLLNFRLNQIQNKTRPSTFLINNRSVEPYKFDNTSSLSFLTCAGLSTRIFTLESVITWNGLKRIWSCGRNKERKKNKIK